MILYCEHVLTWKHWELIRLSRREAAAKRWGKTHGYKGAQGGWVYRTDTWQPVCQGWRTFYDKYREAILADLVR
jgi:hypothetical protein